MIPRIKLLLFISLSIVTQALFAGSKYATGSGFFVTSSGYFITNYHVVENANLIGLTDKNGYFINANIIKVDKKNDIALLKAEGTFVPVAIDASFKVLRGAPIIAAGYPNVDIQGIEPKVTDGIVNSLSGLKDDPRYFQISAPIQSGNSGGPLLDMYGNVIGIVSAKLDSNYAIKATGDIPQNVNFAVKSDYIIQLINTIPEVRKDLKQINKKKLSDASEVFKDVEKSLSLVFVTNNYTKPTTTSPNNQNIKKPSNWTLMFKDGDTSYYADYARSKVSGNNVNIWVLSEHSTVVKSMGETYISAISLREYSCNTNEMRTLNEYGYKGHMGSGEISYTRDASTSKLVYPPGSIGELQTNMICGKFFGNKNDTTQSKVEKENDLIWTPVSTAEDSQWFIEERLITRDGNFVTFSTKINTTKKVNSPKGFYQSSAIEWTIDCNQQLNKLNKGATYQFKDFKGGPVEVLKVVTAQWQEIIPGSHMDNIYKKVCSADVSESNQTPITPISSEKNKYGKIEPGQYVCKSDSVVNFKGVSGYLDISIPKNMNLKVTESGLARLYDDKNLGLVARIESKPTLFNINEHASEYKGLSGDKEFFKYKDRITAISFFALDGNAKSLKLIWNFFDNENNSIVNKWIAYCES